VRSSWSSADGSSPGSRVLNSGQPDSAHFREHERLPPRRPAEHRRRSGGGRADGESVLVQPERLHAGGRRNVWQLEACRVPPAGTQSDRPLSVEELDVRRACTASSPRRHESTRSTTRSGRRTRARTASTTPAPSALTTCNPSNDTFGQILNTRAPREIQLGLKVLLVVASRQSPGRFRVAELARWPSIGIASLRHRTKHARHAASIANDARVTIALACD